MYAPTAKEILAEPSKVPPEDVITWRERVGPQLARIWKMSEDNKTAHVVIIFGNNRSNRPLTTPLWKAVVEDHELDDIALELWEQMWMVPHPQILDFEASMQHMRIMVVAPAPVSPELAWELLDCVRDNVARDMPDYLLTA